MSGRIEASAQSLAFALSNGASAEIVEERILEGVTLRYMEVDGVPVQVPEEPRREVPGIRVTNPDGSASRYVTPSVERARALLARAREIQRSFADPPLPNPDPED